MTLIFLTLLFLFSMGATYWFHNQWRTDATVSPADDDLDADWPMVSILIPARNEARNIRRCVQGVLSQTYPVFEVIVIDDRSEDATPQILAEIAAGEPRLKVIQGQPLPAGWAGKPFALFQAAQQARGEWLCFIDADTFAGPDLIAAALSTAKRHKADMFSILTAQELPTFWERVIMPLVFTAISAAFAPAKVNDPDRSDAIANGQFILIRRSVYEAAGGHRAVWNALVEDLELARTVKGAGYRLVIADGRAYARTRMYTSLPEIWEGWTKNIYLGLQGRLGWLVSGAVGLVLTCVTVIAWPLGVLAWVLSGGGWPAWIALAQVALFLAYLIWQRVQAGRSFEVADRYALALPLAALMLGAMLWTSTFRVLSGRGVTWKGRTYH